MPMLSHIVEVVMAIVFGMFFQAGDDTAGSLIAYVPARECVEEGEQLVCGRGAISFFNTSTQSETTVDLSLDFYVFPASLAWSSDGQQLAFQSFDLYLLDYDQLESRHLSVIGEAGVRNIRWSPDGQYITFSVHTPAYLYNSHLKLLNVATSEDQPLLWQYMHIERPEWSPDGQSIVVSAYEGRGNLEFSYDLPDIVQIDIATQEQRQLTPDDLAGYTPVWSPEGDQIAFIALQGEQEQIAIMNGDGSELEILTTSELRKTRLEWALGNTHLLFIQYDSETLETEMVLLDIETNQSQIIPVQLQRVRTSDGFSGSSLSRDGTQLAYIFSDDENTDLCIYDLVSKHNNCYPETNPDREAVPAWR